MTTKTNFPDSNPRLAQMEHYVGNTPLIPIRNLFQKPGVRIFAKAEWLQFGGSVKARPAYNIMTAAVAEGKLRGGKTLLDASSGNTGIAYAIFAAASGIPLTVCLPENASPERKQTLKSLKADIVFTSKYEGTDGAQAVALELASNHPDRFFYADQYANGHNWNAHYRTTAPEILAQTHGEITHFISGLGTTGTFVGTGRRLKREKPEVRLIALQPDNPLHGLEGWKHLETAKVPAIYDQTVPDEFRSIDTLNAYDMMRDALKYEGLRLSPSSAANLVGAIQLAESLNEGTVVTILPDNADRYTELTKTIFK